LISSFTLPVELQTEIDLIEKNMLSQVEDYHPDLKAAVRLLVSTGGKRIRPLIIILLSKMLDNYGEQVIQLATAIELLHTATLVHDDLIDGALLRRGVPTLNSKWSPAATVLTGDFLFSCAATIAANTANLEVIGLFSKTLTIIVNGEVNQLFSSHCNASKDDYYKRIYAKTASLFETSTKSAAILSNVSDEVTELIRDLGYNLGMAFQIIDDVLDYTGQQNKVGKPVGGDLRQGLITLPMLYYIDEHPDDRAVIRILEGKCVTDEEEIDRIVKAIAQGSAIEKSLNEAKGFSDNALACLDTFPESKEKQLLRSLTNYIVDRKM
jgi:geranylgeranyl pyrophosphate synthase